MIPILTSLLSRLRGWGGPFDEPFPNAVGRGAWAAAGLLLSLYFGAGWLAVLAAPTAYFAATVGHSKWQRAENGRDVQMMSLIGVVRGVALVWPTLNPITILAAAVGGSFVGLAYLVAKIVWRKLRWEYDPKSFFRSQLGIAELLSGLCIGLGLVLLA